MNRTIDIGKDFSDVPAGRFPTDGPYNGELFRKSLLLPAIADGGTVTVILDNTEGFGSSFLEEAFGGLIREECIAKGRVLAALELIATKPRAKRYKRLVEGYIEAAVPGAHCGR